MQSGKEAAMQIAAVAAVGAAGIFLAASLGTYLFVRFTQHRRKGQRAEGAPDKRAPAPEDTQGR